MAAPERESEELARSGETAGSPPHLPVVSAGNFLDPGPARRMHEAKRGAQWRLQLPIGKEIVRCSRQVGCFFLEHRPD